MTQVFQRLHTDYPGIRLNIREGQGSELDALLDTASVDLAILFRHQKPSGPDETLLATANTYLVSRPGLALTAGNTVDFKRLEDLPLVLPSSTPCWVRSRLTRNSAQAAKVVNPDLKRYVTLAHPKQGHFTQASRIVSRLVRETVEGWKGQLFAPAP